MYVRIYYRSGRIISWKMFVLGNECSLFFRRSFCGMVVIWVGESAGGGRGSGWARRGIGGYFGSI